MPVQLFQLTVGANLAVGINSEDHPSSCSVALGIHKSDIL